MYNAKAFCARTIYPFIKFIQQIKQENEWMNLFS